MISVHRWTAASCNPNKDCNTVKLYLFRGLLMQMSYPWSGPAVELPCAASPAGYKSSPLTAVVEHWALDIELGYYKHLHFKVCWNLNTLKPLLVYDAPPEGMRNSKMHILSHGQGRYSKKLSSAPLDLRLLAHPVYQEVHQISYRQGVQSPTKGSEL
jgi:hypothetical protein